MDLGTLTTTRNLPVSGSLPGIGMPPEVYGKVAAPFSVSAAPTVTFNTSTTITSAQTLLSMSSGVPNTKWFNFLSPGLAQRGTAFPQTNILQSFAYNTESLSGNQFSTTFYHSGSQLDIIRYGDASSLQVWVDGQYLGYWTSASNSGTAQAGSANTITLAAGASAVNQQYVGYTVSITGGTGAGQVGIVTGYVGSTKVATMAANWGTNPDATSTYVVVDDVHGYQVDAVTGSVKFINLNWGTVATRRIELISTQFYGINIGPNDTLWPGPPSSATRCVAVADSFLEITGGPFSRHPDLIGALARDCGWQIWPDGEGSTGWCAIYSTGGFQRLNYMDRIAPPPEAWRLQAFGATAGTFTVSVTFAGSTQTTGTIAYNASDTTVQTAIQGLSNLPANSVVVAGGHEPQRGWVVIIHGASGAQLTWNTASITGGTPALFTWPGVVAPRVPTDGNGNALPFVLLVIGSGNDNSGGFTAAQIQANATATAQYIVQNFPTAITIFVGVLSVQTHGVNGVLDATDIGYNTAMKTAAALLPKVNGNTPFVDTYAAGSGGNAWIFGAGNIGTPTTNKNDILISLAASGHPTGEGYSLFSTRIMQNIKALFGA